MLDPSETHVEDARAFLLEVGRAGDPERRRRLIGAAIGHAIGVVEFAIDRAAARASEGLESKKAAQAARATAGEAVREIAMLHLPHYALLKDVRIHNFHRRPLSATVSPQDGRLLAGFVGPVTLPPGSGFVSMTSPGPFQKQAGHSGRSVTYRTDGEALVLLDQDRGVWIRDVEAIEAYLAGVPAFLAEVRPLAPPPTPAAS